MHAHVYRGSMPVLTKEAGEYMLSSFSRVSDLPLRRTGRSTEMTGQSPHDCFCRRLRISSGAYQCRLSYKYALRPYFQINYFSRSHKPPEHEHCRARRRQPPDFLSYYDTSFYVGHLANTYRAAASRDATARRERAAT